jgi:hypothetical protein
LRIHFSHGRKLKSHLASRRIAVALAAAAALVAVAAGSVAAASHTAGSEFIQMGAEPVVTTNGAEFVQ